MQECSSVGLWKSGWVQLWLMVVIWIHVWPLVMVVKSSKWGVCVWGVGWALYVHNWIFGLFYTCVWRLQNELVELPFTMAIWYLLPHQLQSFYCVVCLSLSQLMDPFFLYSWSLTGACLNGVPMFRRSWEEFRNDRAKQSVLYRTGFCSWRFYMLASFNVFVWYL